MEPTDLNSFFDANHVVIVDSNSSARVSLAATLVQLGAKRNRMNLAGTIEEARSEIKRVKPRAVFCDFTVGKASGLDLIVDQKQEYGDEGKSCIFVLVTGNASQSNVARAAEEDVDTFVIKPYTLQIFRKCIHDAIEAKLNPSEYSKLISDGKEKLEQGAFDLAIERFAQAKRLDSKPSLAYFYDGQAEFMRDSIEKSENSYRRGLGYNKIHYKCLVGLFDLLMKQKKFDQAYDVMKRLAQYFPANPKRLASVLRLAIVTSNYDDIEGYYRIFTQIDERTDELVRYVCSALAITAKYYLGQSTRSRGLDLFDKIAVSCAGRTQFMRYAVEALIEYDCVNEAAEYLDHFPAGIRGGEDYLLSALIVAGSCRPSGEVIQMARDLIQRGIERPEVYLVLIEHTAVAGHTDSAEHLVAQASQRWVERAVDFDSALRKGSAKAFAP